MLFTQFEFIFYLIPFTLFLFYRLPDKVPVLLFSSLIFYASWNYRFLPLLIVSIAIGYFSGILLYRSSTRPLLVLTLFLNFLPLSYFKYAGFLASNLGMDPDSVVWTTILPLGISFYTFQQISYLIEIYKGYPPERNFLRYALFVAFFPQLIAGPIMRPQQISPTIAEVAHHRSKFQHRIILFRDRFFEKGGYRGSNWSPRGCGLRIVWRSVVRPINDCSVGLQPSNLFRLFRLLRHGTWIGKIVRGQYPH